MSSNSYGLLGICRRAGRLSMGHDMCKASIRSGKAKLCIIGSDSSQRIAAELMTLCKESGIRMFRIPLTIDEIHHLIGYKAGVMTVDDSGFAESVIRNFNKNTFVEEISL